MKSAVLEKPTTSVALDTDRLRAIVLVRIACAAEPLASARLAADLGPLTLIGWPPRGRAHAGRPRDRRRWPAPAS